MNLGTLGTSAQGSNVSDYKRTTPNRKLRSYLVSERFLLTIIKILASDVVIMRRKLINIKKFLDMIDRDYYQKDLTLDAMITVCDTLIDSRTKSGNSPSEETLIFKVNALLDDSDYDEVKNDLIIPQIKVAKIDSVEDDLEYVSESLEQNLKYGFILDTKDDLTNLTSELTRCSYRDFPETLNKYRDLLTSIMNFFRSTDNGTNINSIMHTSDPSFVDYLYDTYEAIRNPASALQTGWVAMNSALGPRGGFQNKNVYCYYANTNSFKSALLLHLARMIRDYNAVKVIDEYKKTGKTPTVLFIELENDFDEDNERLFKITVKKDIGRCTSREELESAWSHTFESNKENPIDISFMHMDSRSLSVDELERIIEMLEEEGFHVIATIIDYIALLKPRAEDMNRDLRLQLKNISEDLLSLAKNKNIPIITAHQLNRAGGAVLANLKMQGGTNVVNQMTNEFIGESYDIEKTVSWTMFIDLEKHGDRKFLTCKRNKCRYAGKFGTEYFVYEIKDGIIIDDDIYDSKPGYLTEVPGTISDTQNGDTSYAQSGKRGLIDIRDNKEKTPSKDHEIIIKPKENTLSSTEYGDNNSINMLDLLINPYNWVDYVDKYGIDELTVDNNTFDEYSSTYKVIGETEYCFVDDPIYSGVVDYEE